MQLESARLGKLIKEIVDLSRLQSADGMQQPRPVLIAEVVREAVDLSLIEAEAKGIRIVERVAPGAVAYGDYSLLVTAVRNLIDKAIAVADRGGGIPAVEQERIFERFYRVDAARSRSTGGTGLGLAIVKHICANHGGRVSVWSRQGHGSTFTISLPPAPAPEVGAAPTLEGSSV